MYQAYTTQPCYLVKRYLTLVSYWLEAMDCCHRITSHNVHRHRTWSHPQLYNGCNALPGSGSHARIKNKGLVKNTCKTILKRTQSQIRLKKRLRGRIISYTPMHTRLKHIAIFFYSFLTQGVQERLPP